MTGSFWLSVGVGVGVGMIYGVVAALSLLIALRKTGQQFMTVFVGGMLARLVLVLALTFGVLLLVPVEPFPFAIALAICVLGVLGIETLVALRRLRSGLS